MSGFQPPNFLLSKKKKNKKSLQTNQLPNTSTSKRSADKNVEILIWIQTGGRNSQWLVSGFPYLLFALRFASQAAPAYLHTEKILKYSVTSTCVPGFLK